MDPENVKSPKRRWRLRRVLHSTGHGEDGWSAAEGSGNMSTECGARCLQSGGMATAPRRSGTSIARLCDLVPSYLMN